MKPKHDSETGKFISYKHPTPQLKSEVKRRLQKGDSDTEVARWLMNEQGVKIYYAVRLIQAGKKGLDSV
jgi:cytochrome c-type biogenesis protein CcmH/NrfF